MSSSLAQLNVLYTLKAAGPIACRKGADYILASFALSPLASVNSCKHFLHCRKVLAKLLLSRSSASGRVSGSILTPCVILLSYNFIIIINLSTCHPITTVVYTGVHDFCTLT